MMIHVHVHTYINIHVQYGSIKVNVLSPLQWNSNNETMERKQHANTEVRKQNGKWQKRNTKQ